MYGVAVAHFRYTVGSRFCAKSFRRHPMKEPMRTFLLAALAAGLAPVLAPHALISHAEAAERIVPLAYDWSGFYVGGQVGYADGGIENVSVDATGMPLTGPTRDPLLSQDFDEVSLSLLAGGNIQLGRAVLGVEFNYDYLDGETDATIDSGIGAQQVTFELDRIFVLKGRAGYAFGRFLPFVAGGVSFASFDAGFTAGTFFDEAREEDLTGFNVGGGFEYALTEHAIARLDYTFTEFDEKIDFLNAQTFSAEIDAIHQVKLGLSYKF